MNPQRRPLISLLYLLALATGSNASAATLSGFVRDADSGEKLPGASIAVAGTGYGAVANADGYFAIRNLLPGEYPLAITYIGYGDFADTVAVGKADVRFDVTLEPVSIRLETGVVVTAERDARERSAQPSLLPLRMQQLEQLPAAGEADLLRSLQLLPGIQSASDISSGLYVRGGGPDQTRILLDQIPLYNPSHAFGFFSTFNPDAVRDVQLYKGAYPASYGGSLGAVLNVRNHEGNNRANSARGGVSLIAARLLIDGPVGDGSWTVSGRRTYLDPVLRAARASGVDVPDYFFYDVNAHLTQRLSDADSITLTGFFGRDDLDFDLDAETAFGPRWGNTLVAARWTRIITPALVGHLTAFSSHYESTTAASFFATPWLFANTIRDRSLRADFDYFASSSHSLSGGVTMSRLDFSFDEVFNQRTQLDLRQSSTLAAAYVQDDWQLGRRSHLRLGGRASYFSEGDRLHLLPRLSLSHEFRPGWRLKLGAGRYRQYLQLISTEGFSGGDFWVPLDDSVQPGSSLQTVAGLEWEPARRYLVSLEGYYTALDDLVVLDNNRPADAATRRSEELFVTGGEGRATGVELFLQRRTGRLTGWVGYTLGWTERRFAGLNAGRSFPPKYDRRHDLSFVSSYRAGTWTFGASFIYATGQAFTPAAARYTLRSPSTGVVDDYILPGERNSARLLPYHRLDVGVKRAVRLFGNDAEFYLQVFNLYSRRNEWFVQYDTDNPETEPTVVKMLPVIPSFGLNFEL